MRGFSPGGEALEEGWRVALEMQDLQARCGRRAQDDGQAKADRGERSVRPLPSSRGRHQRVAFGLVGHWRPRKAGAAAVGRRAD